MQILAPALLVDYRCRSGNIATNLIGCREVKKEIQPATSAWQLELIGPGCNLASFVHSFEAVEGSGCAPVTYTPTLACNAKLNTRTHASSSITRHTHGLRAGQA